MMGRLLADGKDRMVRKQFKVSSKMRLTKFVMKKSNLLQLAEQMQVSMRLARLHMLTLKNQLTLLNYKKELITLSAHMRVFLSWIVPLVNSMHALVPKEEYTAT